MSFVSIVLFAIFTSPFLTSPQSSTIPHNQGLQAGAPINDNGTVNFTDQTATLISQTGAGWVRINFRLGACFQDWTSIGCNGITALQEYDLVVNSALSKNLKVLGLLSNETWPGGPSAWVLNNAEIAGGNGDNSYLQHFSSQAAVVLALHFAGKVSTWEIWNEPSQATTYLYPSNFAWLITHIYSDTIQAGVSGISLVSGGITCLQDSQHEITSISSGADYLTETYTQGISLAGWEAIRTTGGSYPLNGVGQHLFIDGFGDTSSERVSMCLDSLRNAYTAFEGITTTKKTTVTEFGWATDNVSEATQTRNLQIAYRTFIQTPYVQNAYWFFLQDVPVSSSYFGLIRPDDSHKPAWNAYITSILGNFTFIPFVERD